MMVLVSYDVSTVTAQGRHRLRRVVGVCEDYGQRVQSSMFECTVDPTQFAQMKLRLLAEYDEKEDSLRFYFLGSRWRGKVEHVGSRPKIGPEAPLF